MRKLAVIAALCAALPIAAQDKPQGTQPKPVAGPALEKPGMAAPDAKSEKPAKPAAPKTANPDSGKTVEEIIARVINSEVGSHITISDEEVTKYYEAHKTEFVRPEQVALREIVVSTEGKKPEDLPDLKKRAETALKRVQDGEDFAEIAKRLSDGSTKNQGGLLGTYKRGELSKDLEDKVFKMKRNELTEVMETRQGFLVLQTLEHYDEGEQSLPKVKNEIMDKLYGTRMEPAMREYLKTLREQSYVALTS